MSSANWADFRCDIDVDKAAGTLYLMARYHGVVRTPLAGAPNPSSGAISRRSTHSSAWPSTRGSHRRSHRRHPQRQPRHYNRRRQGQRDDPYQRAPARRPGLAAPLLPPL
jgi:hypothetical protein